MRLVEINRGVSFSNRMNGCGGGVCKPRPKSSQTCYKGVVIVENPKTQRALRDACRVIAYDMYQKSKKA